MNHVLVTGRVVHEPVMRTTKNGKPFCIMRFCVQGDYRGRNVERETEFIDVYIFGEKSYVLSKKFRKGLRLLIAASFLSYEHYDSFGQKRRDYYLRYKWHETLSVVEDKEPIETLTDSSGNLLIPKEITDSLIRQIDATDEDMPDDFAERSIDDLLQD